MKKRYKGIKVELIEGTNGVFEIVKDGDLIFSKKAAGRFPDPEEIYKKLDS